MNKSWAPGVFGMEFGATVVQIHQQNAVNITEEIRVKRVSNAQNLVSAFMGNGGKMNSPFLVQEGRAPEVWEPRPRRSNESMFLENYLYQAHN
jgi:hypothetical protein